MWRKKKKWTEANWFIDRLQSELFAVCVLWKEEFTDLGTVLNEIAKRNDLYIPVLTCNKKCYLKLLTKKSKRKPKR